LKAASTQLDDGADFLKLYLDGPKKEEAPWSTEDVRAVVDLAHGRGAKVTAHSGFLPGARVGIDAGVDSLEHGFELDSDAAATMRGGELLGEAEAGRIVEGGPADFFLVHGDPLSDASALWRVWKVAWLP